MRTSAERTQIIAERMRATGRSERLWVRNSRQPFEVYDVPVDSLVLNVDNRRFRAERMLAEEQLGRSLDPENDPEDERTVESLLLDTSHHTEGGHIVGTPTDDYEALKNDWLSRGQDSPFWIRPDGTVRNGNRRLAMIKRLQRDSGDTGHQWVEALILQPADVDEALLLEMEQREQLTENFKLRYNDIDYLLALREAAENRDIDWFDRDGMDMVAGQLQSMVEKSKGEVLRDLYAIKYMDQFLEDLARPGQYHRLLRQLERFRDIGRMMQQVEENYPDEAAEILQVLFAAVRAGKTHNDIRAVRQMFRRDRQRFERLAQEIQQIEEREVSSDGPVLLSPSEGIATSPQEDEDDDDEPPGPRVTNYPGSDVARAIDVAIDGFDASREGDALRVLREIRNRIDVLQGNSRLRQAIVAGGANSQAAREDLAAIVSWVDAHRDLIP